MHNGVSLGSQTRPFVIPTELSQLKDLERYVRIPGDTPCTKIQMYHQALSSTKQEAFLIKPEKERNYVSQSKTIKKPKKMI